MKENKKNTLRIAIAIAIVLLIIDQATKIIAIATNIDMVVLNNILEFRLAFNNGAAFSIGKNANIGTFIISNLLVLGIIIRFIFIQKDRMDTPTMLGLFAVLAGGIGNLIDRIFRGNVVDFIVAFPKTNFPIFNIADICIVIGWIVLAFVFAMYTYKEIQNRKKEKKEKLERDNSRAK